jgi:hypothetical protein
MAEGRLTFHAQIGYRRLEDSRRAYAEIHDRLADRGWAPDRYGICLDIYGGDAWAERNGMENLGKAANGPLAAAAAEP